MVKVQKHTDTLTQQQILALLEHKATPCVSIYMPTIRKGPETRQNAIRLKNLLSEAESQLSADGIDDDLLAPAYELPNTEGWKYLGDGLALFIAPDMFEMYRLPLEMNEAVEVDQRFYVKPLIPIMNRELEFYVLALDQDNTRLLHGTPYHIHEVEMPDTPTSLPEAMRYDLDEKQLQFHSATAYTSTSGSQEAAFHGQGQPSDDEITELLRFFQMLDRGVYNQIGDTQTPLILVGLDSLQGLYRQVNSYNGLIEEGANTNPAPLRDEEVQQIAWELISPRLNQGYEEAVSTYKQLAGNDDPRIVDGLEAVVPAAYYERVDTLFVRPEAQQWGRFVTGENKVQLDQQAAANNTELIDFAIAHTWVNGGRVYNVADDSLLQQDATVAAILRY